jgi:hypothetical protein
MPENDVVELLVKLRELDKLATPGPWEAACKKPIDGAVVTNLWHVRAPQAQGAPLHIAGTGGFETKHAGDAAFIAFARSATIALAEALAIERAARHIAEAERGAALVLLRAARDLGADEGPVCLCGHHFSSHDSPNAIETRCAWCDCALFRRAPDVRSAIDELLDREVKDS